MTYRMLTDLPAAVRASGLPVVLVDGWERRGRPATSGGFNPRGVVVHHTGDTIGNDRSRERAYAHGTLRDGFDRLPGPLCQLGLGRDGTVYVIAAGRANHAGESRRAGFMAPGDGNSQAIGIEAMNSGYEGWTDRQLDAYHRVCAALCDHYRWPRGNVRAHAESSTAGKWDPGLGGRVINMQAFRRGVAAVRKGGAAMALSKKEVDQIADATAAKVWDYVMRGARGDKPESAGERLRLIRASTRETNESIDRDGGETRSLLQRLVKKIGA